MAGGTGAAGPQLIHYTPSAAERVWAAGFLTLLVVAPWPNGMAAPWLRPLAVAAVLLLAATAPRGRFPVPWVWTGIFCLVAAPVAFQLYPLPLWLASLLAPGRVEAAYVAVRAAVASGLAPGTGLFLGGIPLSSAPPLTVRALLGLLASAAWVYCAAVYFSTRGRARPFLLAAAAVGAVLAGSLLAARAGIGTPTASLEGGRTVMGFGAFINKNHAASLLAVVALIQGGGMLAGRRYSGVRLRVLLALGFLASLATLLLAGSRGGQLAFLAGLMVVAVGNVRGLRPLALVPVLLVLAAAPLLTDFGQPATDAPGDADHPDRSLEIRRVIWQDSLRAALAHQPFGSGLGTYEQVYPRFRTLRALGRVNSAHNEPLQWLLEAGLIPAITLVLASGALIVFSVLEGRGSKSFRGRLCGAMGAAVCAAGIHSLADFPLRNPAVGLWVLAAVGYLLARAMRRGARYAAAPAGSG